MLLNAYNTVLINKNYKTEFAKIEQARSTSSDSGCHRACSGGEELVAPIGGKGRGL